MTQTGMTEPMLRYTHDGVDGWKRKCRKDKAWEEKCWKEVYRASALCGSVSTSHVGTVGRGL